MGREQFQNFATTALASSITSSSTSISLTSGSGSSFPSSGPFVIVIDTELILIASRSTDTLTVASGGRGYDGTTAASHNSGTTVQLPVCAYNMNHLWQNVPDTFNPMVPPAQSPLSATGVPSGSADSHDNEMEAQGSWVLNPTSLPTGAVFDVGVTNRSHLTFKRGTGTDNTFYSAYTAFSPGSTAWTATCKMSDGFNVPANGSQTAEFHFFASDSSTPTVSDPGNAIRLDVIAAMTVTSGTVSSSRLVRPSKDVAGVWNSFNSSIIVAWGVPLYLRMNNDGAGRWQLFVGDGITYTLLVDQTFSFTVATLGVAIQSGSGNTNLNHTVLVDFVRVVMGQRLQFYG